MTCSSNRRVLEKVTPSNLTDTTCSIPVMAEGNEDRGEGLWKTISLVLYGECVNVENLTAPAYHKYSTVI